MCSLHTCGLNVNARACEVVEVAPTALPFHDAILLTVPACLPWCYKTAVSRLLCTHNRRIKLEPRGLLGFDEFQPTTTAFF
jgi:hypothetical protein